MVRKQPRINDGKLRRQGHHLPPPYTLAEQKQQEALREQFCQRRRNRGFRLFIPDHPNNDCCW